jgi:hypothetical protein
MQSKLSPENQIPVKPDPSLLDADGSGKLLPENPGQSNPGQIIPKPAQFELYYTRYKDADSLIRQLHQQNAELHARVVELEVAARRFLNATEGGKVEGWFPDMSEFQDAGVALFQALSNSNTSPILDVLRRAEAVQIGWRAHQGEYPRSEMLQLVEAVEVMKQGLGV